MNVCPNCSSEKSTKSGVIGGRQRFRCKGCGYHYTVAKKGKGIDDYYVNKALQLYLEGLSYREIERVLGVSHVSVINWVKKYRIKRPSQTKLHPNYEILSAPELTDYFANPAAIKGAGVIVTELGDKFMVIRWERFRS